MMAALDLAALSLVAVDFRTRLRSTELSSECTDVSSW